MFDVACGVNFEHESGLAWAGVGDSMDMPTADHGGVARSEHSVLAATAEPDRAGQHLEALVLTDVEMPGNEAAGFEADLTVFAQDPMAAAEKEIPRIPVVLTLVGGRVAYGRGLAAGKTP